MTACTHPRISAWCDQETGERVRLWSCTECCMKFYPADEVHPALDENERLREDAERMKKEIEQCRQNQ